MKQNTTRIALVSACLGLTANAAPFMAVGDNAELFVTGTASVQADDNIFLNGSNEVSDTIFSFTPGVDLVFGKNAATKGNFFYREEIRRFSDNDNQNVSLSSLGLNSAYDNGVTKATFNASYAQLAQNTKDVNPANTIVHRDLTGLGANLEFGLSEKTSLGAALNYNRTNYGPATYVDSSIWSLPIDVYYKATAKLAWSLGYQYRNTNLSGAGIDSQDHFFNVGARGEFTEKLTGQIRVGLTERNFDVGGDDSQFGLSGNLAYAYSEKTTIGFNLSNDFGSSGQGESTKAFNLGFNANSKVTEQWQVGGSLSYTKTDYPTRTEDYVEGSLSLSYALNQMVNFGASYTHRSNSSDLNPDTAKFSGNVFMLSANVRY